MTDMEDVWSGIMQCAVKNDVPGILELVRMGCPVSFANRMGQTVLHIGSLWGSKDAVRTLLELRADVHARNRLRGSTPLHSAAQGRGPPDKRVDCIKLLLGAKANPAARDSEGCTPMDVADAGEVQEALGAAPLLLHKAVKAKKQEQLADVLHQVKSGAVPIDIDVLDPDGLSALHLAVSSSWRTGLDTLLAARADVRTQAHNGESPVHTAVKRGDNLSLTTLLAAGAEVHLRDQDRDADPRFKSISFEQDPTQHRTPLHYAAHLGNVVALGLLLGARADPNVRDSHQQTSLNLALEARKDTGVLEMGRGVRIVGTKNEKLNGSIGAIIGALGKPSDGGAARWPVLLDGHAGDGFLLKAENLAPLPEEAIAALLDAKADVNLGGSQSSEETRTTLHDAARSGDTALAKLLLGARVAVDQQDKQQGFSALHFAARSRHVEMARLLVDARADLSLRTGQGASAAELAEKNAGSPALVALLRGEEAAAQAEPPSAPPDAASGAAQRLADLTPEQRAALFLD